MKNDNLHWYVLNYDFNGKKVINFDIFSNWKFIEGVSEIFVQYLETKDYIQFKEKLRQEIMYHFWSRREYEISVGDAFETNLDKYEKIDIYSQVLPNLDRLAEYIIKENID